MTGVGLFWRPGTKLIRLLLLGSLLLFSAGIVGCEQSSNKVTQESAAVSKEPQSDPEGSAFIANSSTKIYHMPECRTITEMADANKTWHMTTERAESRGYRACKVCKPDAPAPPDE